MLNKIWNQKLSGLPSLIYQSILICFDRSRDFFSTLFWKGNLGDIGSQCKIQGNVAIRYPKNINLKNNISIGRYSRIVSEYPDSKLQIGSMTTIDRYVDLDYTGDLIIGKKVTISEYVCLYTHDHGYDPRSKPAKTPLHIEDDVWIGGHAIILEGVTRIGKGSMIAAGSVVTREVPPGCIVAGVPAKVIRKKEFK